MTRRLLFSHASVRWFVHPDQLLHQIRLHRGSKLLTSDYGKEVVACCELLLVT